MQTPGRIDRSPWVCSVLIILLVWREREIERLIELLVYGLKQTTWTTPVEVNLGLEVIFLMTRRHEISGWRLTICVRSCTVGCMLKGTKHPHQAQDLI